jgi:2-oxoglutarate ferredoxin oxidoreductase subunit beta
MTGGQMAPTTILGQVTQTTPLGRDAAQAGFPLQVSEMLAVLPGAVYIERCSLHDVPHIRKAKKAVRHAFELQCNKAPGLAMVELLSPCPTAWRMSPKQAVKWLEQEMIKVFPLGCLKDIK